MMLRPLQGSISDGVHDASIKSITCGLERVYDFCHIQLAGQFITGFQET